MVGGFSKVLLTIKGHLEYKTFCLFYVDNVNQLSRSQEPVIDYPYVIKHKIMVIGYVDRKYEPANTRNKVTLEVVVAL